MLILWRIVFGAALVYVMGLAIEAGDRGWQREVAPAFYLALCVIIGLANAIVWAPWIGEKVAGPLSSLDLGDGAPPVPSSAGLRLARHLEARGRPRLARLVAFAEGVRHPDAPGPFLIGLRNARPGSWLEKVFALEVYRFDNLQNVLKARNVLLNHGVVPPPHPNGQVDAALLAMEREERPEARRLHLPG